MSNISVTNPVFDLTDQRPAEFTLPMRFVQNMFLAGFLIAAPIAAMACPAAPDHRRDIARTLDQVQVAKTASEARRLQDRLWYYWTDAPDDRAQDLLDAGMRAREIQDFASARASLDELVRYCPNFAEGYNQRAFVAFLTLDFEAALVDLERAIELSPNHVAAISGRGLTLLQLGRLKAGYASIRQALELNPWIPERAYLPPDTSQEL